MKAYKKFLRAFLTAVSVGGFLAGWVIIAHNPRNAALRNKPQDLLSVELAPVPQLDQLVQTAGGQAGQGVAFAPTSRQFRFRTGGS